MNKKKITIDGTRFSNLDEFYTEIDMKLTKGLNWKTGHNLDAFNDLLRGGFGVHEYYEPISLVWKNAKKSKEDFGYDVTVKYYEKLLKTCHSTNVDKIGQLLECAKRKQGYTLFEIIIQIIKKHDSVELIIN